jgi:uncharacterized protein (DUF1800 family)
MISETIYAAGTRFGLGLKPGEAERIGGSPQNWLMDQIESPQMTGAGFATLPSSAQNATYLQTERRKIKQEQKGDDKSDALKMLRGDQKDFFVEELRARIDLAMTTDTPFYERLVDFWSNHFAVSIKKGPVVGLAGAYEREAIRPHVTGRFVDMLLAVAHHPAMLVYLDNAQSIGPGSIAGERQGKGLNENLAREIMELHTLGVGGGYTQTDVTTFAKVITGWTVGGPDSDHPGAFNFTPRRHEPGAQRILGRDYPEQGEDQGVAVLRDLARQPVTARHIATKIARHFIADDPPESAVARLAQVFLDKDGDLKQVYYILTGIPEAWDVRANPKIKNGYDLVISAARASGRSGDPYVDYCVKSLKFLGDIPFSANSPAGQPDVARDIAGPEAMIRRVQWAQMAAIKFEPAQKATELAALSVGPMLSDVTKGALSGAKNDREAVAILFGSPEFQRR